MLLPIPQFACPTTAMELQHYLRARQVTLVLLLLIFNFGSLAFSMDPTALGSTSFTFEPLFDANNKLRFVYAFESEDQDEANSQPITQGSTVTIDTSVAAWLEYDKYPTLTPTAHQLTDFIVLMNENITGTPSDGNNGCDGVWGKECSENLKSYVKQLIANELNVPGLESAMSTFVLRNVTDVEVGMADPVANLSCPWGVLNKYYISLGYLIPYWPEGRK
jgi:hypothetical protein